MLKLSHESLTLSSNIKFCSEIYTLKFPIKLQMGSIKYYSIDFSLSEEETNATYQKVLSHIY